MNNIQVREMERRIKEIEEEKKKILIKEKLEEKEKELKNLKFKNSQLGKLLRRIQS